MKYDICMTNAGFKYEGSWEEICEFSKDLENIISHCIHKSDSIQHYHHWRPREDDNEKDITDKTAEEAVIKKTKVEKEFDGTKEEIVEAEEKFKDSIKEVKNGHNPSKDLKEASKHMEKLVETKSIQSLRNMEEIIYKKLMLKFNPYYFDTEDFSVNIEDKKDRYILTINISDENKRESMIEDISIEKSHNN